MLTKLQFQTLFGFKPKRRSASKAGKKVVRKSAKKSARKSASKAGKKVVRKSNKVGTRVIKGVKRTVYKGKNGGKYYKKSDGRKVYFGPAVALAKSLGVKSAARVIGAKALEGAGYTLGYKAANVGVSMLKKAVKKNKKATAMGRKKIVAGKKRTVYKSPSGAKYYKSAKGNKVYFGEKSSGMTAVPNKAVKDAGATSMDAIAANKIAIKDLQENLNKYTKDVVGRHVHRGESGKKWTGVMAPDPNPRAKFGKKRRSSRKNNRFGNHGYAGLDSMMGPAPVMFASHVPII